MPRIHHKSNPLIRIEDLITIHYETFQPEHYFGGETHPFWEIVYVDKGTISACNDTNVFEAKEGELLFHAPDVFHFAKGNGHSKSNVFILTFTSSSPAIDNFKDKCIAIPSKARQLISNIIFEANGFYNLGMRGLVPLPDQNIGGDQLIRIYLEELLILLYRSMQMQTKVLVPASELTARVVALLNSKIYDTLTVEEVCKYTSFSKTQLSKIFKDETGKSVMEYYRDIKLKTAKGLLKSTQYSITEISEIFCYDNPQYFSKTFKKKYGITPTEYKESVNVD